MPGLGLLTLEELFRQWPQTLAIFAQHNMACAGCPVARFSTIEEAAAAYDLDADLLLREVERQVGDSEAAQGTAADRLEGFPLGKAFILHIEFAVSNEEAAQEPVRQEERNLEPERGLWLRNRDSGTRSWMLFLPDAKTLTEFLTSAGFAALKGEPGLHESAVRVFEVVG